MDILYFSFSIWMEFHATNVIRKQEKRSLSANPANNERFEARRQEDLNLRPLA